MDARILFVDDKDSVRQSIENLLRSEGFTVQTAPNGRIALHMLATYTPDLAILDVHMPVMDGLELCREIQNRWSHIPVILISGERTEIDHRIAGLATGAVRYILKPIHPTEFLFEVRSILRFARARSQGGDQWLQIDDYLQVNPTQRQVRVDGKQIHVSPREFDLLLYLIEHAGQLCTRDELLEAVWQQSFPSDDAINSRISSLRQKIEPDRSRPRYIISRRGFGYEFCNFD